jgi:hypothetical protein
MRLGTTVASVVLFAAACGYDEGKDLPGIVERAAPAEAELIGECAGPGGLIESPSYHCTYFAHGEAIEVTTAVADALAEQNFDVSCRDGDIAIEIAGFRADVGVRAEVTADGSVTDSGDGAVNVFEPGYVPPGAKPIPTGAVALALSASRLTDAGADTQQEWVADGVACSADRLRQQTLAGCVEAWNGPGNDTNRLLVVRRLRVPAAYVLLLRSHEPGVSTGCFFRFLAPRGRSLDFESSWREGSLVFEKAQLGYASGRGLDADARVRRDGTLELKPPSLNERCEVWWNGQAGAETKRIAASRRLTAKVEAVYTPGDETRCTYTLRSRDEYVRVIAVFSDSEFSWTPITPVEPPRRFRPNGELEENGWLSVGPSS